MHTTVSKFIHRFFKDELNELYINNFIRTFALGLVYAFIPLFLLSKGYTLQDAVLYMGLIYFFLFFIAPFAVFVSEKIGLKHTFILNIPLTVLFFFFLYTVTDFNWPIYLLSFFYAATIAFYWMPYNTLFAIDGKKKHLGSEIGTHMALADIAGVFSPLIGAFLIEEFGFLVAFIVCPILLIVAVLPLFLTPEHKLKSKHNWGNIFSKKNWWLGLNFFFEAIVSSAMVLWPIFVYLIHSEYLFIGFIALLGGIGAAVITYALGWLSDKFGKEILIRVGGFLLAVSWLLPIFFVSDLVISIVSFSHGFLISLIALPIFAQACEAAHKQGAAEFMIFRETALGLGRILVFGIFFFVLDFNVLFIIAMVASLYFLLFAKKG